MRADPLEATTAAYQPATGYVTCEGLLSLAEVEALRRETAAIVRGERGDIVGSEAGDGRSDDDLLGGVIAVHFPHKISPLMREAMFHPRVVEVLKAIIGPHLKSMQTMLFVKRSGEPGQERLAPGRALRIPTRDRSLCSAWIALDDATIENGCLWMHPGSPRARHHSIRCSRTTRRGSTPADEVFDHPYEREGGVPVELKAGGVAFFNGYVLHRSLPNRARRAAFAARWSPTTCRRGPCCPGTCRWARREPARTCATSSR